MLSHVEAARTTSRDGLPYGSGLAPFNVSISPTTSRGQQRSYIQQTNIHLINDALEALRIAEAMQIALKQAQSAVRHPMHLWTFGA